MSMDIPEGAFLPARAEHPELSRGLAAVHNLVFNPPVDGSKVSYGESRLDWSECRILLGRYLYVGQRSMRRSQVGGIAASMRAGEFDPYSVISLAFTEQGVPVIVDGQHRLTAAHDAQWTGTWLFRVYWEGSAEEHYHRLDRHQIRRSDRDAGESMVDIPLRNSFRSTCMGAARWQVQWTAGYELPPQALEPVFTDIDVRFRLRVGEYQELEELIFKGGYTDVVRRFSNPRQLAVMAETLAHCHDKALEFWKSVMGNGPGTAVQYRLKLAEGRPKRWTANYPGRLAGTAWNRRNRTTALRVPDNGLVVVEHTDLHIPR